MGGSDPEENEQELNLINGVENAIGDFVRGKLGQDTFIKTVTEIRKVLPSLYHMKVVSVSFTRSQ